MHPGLSYEQAPPLTVPLSYMLAAPLFAVLAGALLVFCGADALQSRWSGESLALTHLLTLGFMASTMMGALTQMLPVLAGVPLPQVVDASRLTWIGVVAGTLLLCAGFMTGTTFWIGSALSLLGAGFLVFFLAAGLSLWRSPVRNASVAAMRLAFGGFVLTVILGGVLVCALAGLVQVVDIGRLTDAHASWGMIGTVALLVVGVAFQVVPMLQMTPEYRDALARWLPRILFAGLLLWTLVQESWAARWVAAPVALALVAFALVTLRLQARRRRRLPDPVLWFWRVALASLLAAVALWLAAPLFPDFETTDRYPVILGVLLGGGFALAIITGMLYKIVAFLVWFHLQARHLGARIPNMKEIMPDRWVRRQFAAYAVAYALLIAAAIGPQTFGRAAGIALALSSAWLWVNLVRAARIWWSGAGAASAVRR
jgi:hypothetical protein